MTVRGVQKRVCDPIADRPTLTLAEKEAVARSRVGPQSPHLKELNSIALAVREAAAGQWTRPEQHRTVAT
jgi:hypothetical protein